MHIYSSNDQRLLEALQPVLIYSKLKEIQCIPYHDLDKCTKNGRMVSLSALIYCNLQPLNLSMIIHPALSRLVFLGFRHAFSRPDWARRARKRDIASFHILAPTISYCRQNSITFRVIWMLKCLIQPDKMFHMISFQEKNAHCIEHISYISTKPSLCPLSSPTSSKPTSASLAPLLAELD